MSSCSGYGVVLFESVQGALGAERRLVAAGVEHKLIAVPRQISSKCGFCLRIRWEERGRVEEVLRGARLGVERMEEL